MSTQRNTGPDWVEIERGERDAISMSEEQRPRPSVGQLFLLGLLGAVLAIFTSGIISSHGGAVLFAKFMNMNAWLLKQMSSTLNRGEAEQLLILQIAGVGFTLGAAVGYLLPRSRTLS